jgi:16S rRNA G527 N7-methylase RsmG
MAAQLELQNVHTIWARAEEYKDKQYDAMLARAVAFSDKLFKWTYTLVKK